MVQMCAGFSFFCFRSAAHKMNQFIWTISLTYISLLFSSLVYLFIVYAILFSLLFLLEFDGV